jgi:hypothetical protein
MQGQATSPYRSPPRARCRMTMRHEPTELLGPRPMSSGGGGGKSSVLRGNLERAGSGVAGRRHVRAECGPFGGSRRTGAGQPQLG